MGWLNAILDKGAETGVLKHARGACQAMLFASLQIRDQNECKPDPECNSYARIAGKALELRPGWKRLPNSNSFVHGKSGLTLTIDDEWSVAQVTREVVGIEVARMVGNLPAPKPSTLVAEAMMECDRFFKMKAGSGR